MSTAEERILGYLQKNDEIEDSGNFAAEQGIDHGDVVNVVKSLHGFRYVDVLDINRETWVLAEEGWTYATKGPRSSSSLRPCPPKKKVGPVVFKIDCSQAGKNKWVEMGKQVSRKVQQVEDRVKELLLQIQDKKAIAESYIKSLKARKVIALEADWKNLEFKEYNFRANGPSAQSGYLHPLMEVRAQFKTIFRLMNFEEMPTNSYVQSRLLEFPTFLSNQLFC